MPPLSAHVVSTSASSLTRVSCSRLVRAASVLLAVGCGGEESGTVDPPACAVFSPSISTFAAMPAAILTGQSATLSWTITGAAQVAVTPTIGTPSGASAAVSPTATTAYVLTATNCAGSTTAQTTVTVSPAALYVSPDQHTPGAPIDGISIPAQYGVGSNAYTRSTPILVRHPQGATGRRPLILWSHGGGMLADGKYHNVEWGNLFVRAGYIVVHMSHVPRTTREFTLLFTEFGLAPPTDTVASEIFEFAANIDRPRDAISVLNALASLEQTNPQLAGRIDFDRIAVAGWSRGSYTARTTACARINLAPTIPRYSFRDASKSTNTPLRVQLKAVMANSPQGPGRLSFYDNGGGDHSWADCTLPDLTQTASGDATDTPPANRVAPFPLLPPGNKHMMFINDVLATHESFGLVNATSPQFDPLISSTALAFMDGYVKGLPAARAYLTSAHLQVMSGNKATLTAR